MRIEREVVLGELVWKGKSLASMEDILLAILSAKDKEEAQQIFNGYVSWGAPKGLTEKTARENIGYFAGYFTESDRLRVFELIGAVHPVFGNNFPTAQDAFQMGLERGRELAEKHRGNK